MMERIFFEKGRIENDGENIFSEKGGMEQMRYKKWRE